LLPVFLQTVYQHGLYSPRGNLGTPSRLRWYLQRLFCDVPLQGQEVLDVGAGAGVFSAYMSVMGANQVLALEPLLNGSRPEKMAAASDAILQQTGIDNVTFKDDTFQSFDPGSKKFDVVLMHSTVNHLDEDACVKLHHEEAACDVYRNIFQKLRQLLRPGGHAILTDCSRYNFFGMLGLKNVLAPTINWKYHQSPYLWRKLMEEAGFQRHSLRWTSPTHFGRIGTLALTNRFASFFLKSHFKLVMKVDA
jgi:2-polyprenyl-3-methyl-5-hydroxy-6-metoxy-1,4-benzoquinol methylase